MENQEHTFTIGEFGRRARITVRTLRFYEELGLLVPSQQNNSGHRLYGIVELEKLQQIQSLKFIGYSLQDIKRLLEDDTKSSAQLETSLALQHKLLTEKRDGLDQAIEAIERVQYLLENGKPVSWTVLSSLLYQMEHEQDLKEWAKAYLSDDMAEQLFSLPKEQWNEMDLEMMDLQSTIKGLIKKGCSPQSPEAFDVLIKLTELATQHIGNIEELADQLEKAQELMSSDMIDFKFPSFLTQEEEAFLEETGKAMEALYKEKAEE